MSAAGPDGAGVRHMLYPYTGEQHYLSGTLAYIERARAEGGTVLVAAPSSRREKLRAHLPAEDAVAFMDTAAVERNPGRLIPAWQDWIGQAALNGPVHGINESVWSGRTSAHIVELRYQEWLLNRAFAATAFWSLMCPFDTSSQSPAEVEAVTRCHPWVWDGAEHRQSTLYDGANYPLEALAEPTGPVEQMTYDGVEGLVAAREAAAGFAKTSGLSVSQARDLKLAVSEVTTNSIRHAGGRGTLRLWRTEDLVVCEVSDSGVITDPLAGRIRPTSAQPGGRGLWFANNLCDLMQIRSTPRDGTRVRLSMILDDSGLSRMRDQSSG